MGWRSGGRALSAAACRSGIPLSTGTLKMQEPPAAAEVAADDKFYMPNRNVKFAR